MNIYSLKIKNIVLYCIALCTKLTPVSKQTNKIVLQQSQPATISVACVFYTMMLNLTFKIMK